VGHRAREAVGRSYRRRLAPVKRRARVGDQSLKEPLQECTETPLLSEAQPAGQGGEEHPDLVSEQGGKALSTRCEADADRSTVIDAAVPSNDPAPNAAVNEPAD
jgi:hypothetical protein